MVFDNTVQRFAELTLDLQIEDYILHHESCRHSPHTILHYRTSLGHLVAFATAQGMAPFLTLWAIFTFADRSGTAMAASTAWFPPMDQRVLGQNLRGSGASHAWAR